VDEIELLDGLLQSGVSTETAALMMERTKMAVNHAIHKLVFQQLFTSSPEDIAKRYKRSVEWIRKDIVDPKYNLTTSPTTPRTLRLLKAVSAVFAVTVVMGNVYWGYLLYNNIR